jgi:hypothetical protein
VEFSYKLNMLLRFYISKLQELKKKKKKTLHPAYKRQRSQAQIWIHKIIKRRKLVPSPFPQAESLMFPLGLASGL